MGITHESCMASLKNNIFQSVSRIMHGQENSNHQIVAMLCITLKNIFARHGMVGGDMERTEVGVS